MDEQVTLSSYADQVRELIRHDRNDEAIAICKHLLRYYPKYINAYRQLGEALLEKRDYEGAKDVFCRVLSADPENAIAYVGLATVFEQEQVVNEAVWNMERAFELAPGNSELKQELVRLYNDLDIKSHTRAKLTAGALARIYAQDGLFAQAIQEFRAIIASVPSRYDIRVALAEALWRMGRMNESAQVAQSILEQLPYCLKANLILGAAWKETGLSESDVYLQRAQSLDPTNQIAAHLFGARSPLPSLRTSVPRYIEGVESTAVVEPIRSETQPSSLFESVLTESHVDFVPAEAAVEMAIPEELVTPTTTDDNLPAWLRRAPSETVDTPKTELRVEDPNEWLSKQRELPAEETAETPAASAPTVDWLNLPNAEVVDQFQTPVESETLPTWLGSPPPESIVELPPAESLPGVEPSQATPDWMRGLSDLREPLAPSQAVRATPPSTEELPPWLDQVPTATPSVEPSQATPEWMRGLSDLREPLAPSQADRATPPSIEELPPWLDQVPTATPAPTEELPVWLAQPAGILVPEIKPGSVVQEQPSAQPVELPTQPQTPAEIPVPAFESPALAEPAPVALPAETPSMVVELPPPPPALAEPAPVTLPAETPSVVVELQPPALAEVAPVALPAETPSIVVELPPPTLPPVETIAVETPAEAKRKRQPKGYGRLVQARAHRDAQRWNDALTEYDYLVQHAPRLVREVIDDLEMLIQRIDIPLETHRILGDAYTRADRLADALERYRFVLEHVS